MPLPVSFCRYSRDAPARFQSIDKSEGKKRDYMHNCKTDGFEDRASKIANDYEPIEIVTEDD